jgi:hypothetical protein
MRQKMETNTYDSLLTLLSVCIQNGGYMLHHTFGILNTNIDPMSKHKGQKRKGEKIGVAMPRSTLSCIAQ